MAGTTTPPQPPPTFRDYRDLWVLKLAKLRRRQFRTDQQDYTNFYEDYFTTDDQVQYVEDRRNTIRNAEINAALKKHLPGGSKLLDVGCGLGDILDAIEPGYEMFGFDFAASNVKIASKRLEKKATIKQGSIYEIPFESNSMDGALCTEVIEHIEDDEKAVKDIARVLKPGGVLIASVPYYYFWPQYTDLMGHFRHYSNESFTKLLAGAGLRVIDHYPNYPNWHRAYMQKYPWVRARHMLFGRFFGSKSLYHFKWPWSSKTKIDQVIESLKPIEEADRRMDYSSLPTSTSVVARKPV